MKLIKIEFKDQFEVDLFERFYKEILKYEFDHNELERYSVLKDHIKRSFSKKFNEGNDLFQIYIKYDDEKDKVVSGIIYDFYRKIRCIGIQFLATNKKYRRQGHMKSLLQVLDQYGDLSIRYRSQVDYLIFEVKKDDEIFKNAKRIPFKFHYIQPRLETGDEEISETYELRYISFIYRRKKGNLEETPISRNRLYEFLYNYIKFACGVKNPLEDRSFLKMKKELKQ